jgi:hypothetical protein
LNYDKFFIYDYIIMSRTQRDRLHRNVRSLIKKLDEVTGETIAWYVDTNEEPYPNDEEHQVDVPNRPEMSSRFLLTMKDVKNIMRDRLTLYVLEPFEMSRGRAPPYDQIVTLDKNHRMFRGTDSIYGSFLSGNDKGLSEDDRGYDKTIACSGPQCHPWIVVKSGLDKFFEKVISVAKRNKREVEDYVRDMERRIRREDREDREDRDRNRREVTRKRKKSKKKKKVKDEVSKSGDGGLVPTVLLGGLLGVIAVMVGMK